MQEGLQTALRATITTGATGTNGPRGHGLDLPVNDKELDIARFYNEFCLGIQFPIRQRRRPKAAPGTPGWPKGLRSTAGGSPEAPQQKPKGTQSRPKDANSTPQTAESIPNDSRCSKLTQRTLKRTPRAPKGHKENAKSAQRKPKAPKHSGRCKLYIHQLPISGPSSPYVLEQLCPHLLSC